MFIIEFKKQLKHFIDKALKNDVLEPTYCNFDVVNIYTKEVVYEFTTESFNSYNRHAFESHLLEILNEKFNLTKNTIEMLYVSDNYATFEIESVPYEVIENKSIKVESNKINIQDIEEYDGDYNPYTDGGWGNMKWYCIRCGSVLSPIDKNDKTWCSAWKEMIQKHTISFLCSNETCCHHNAVLKLHHPFNTTTEPGESYSISWIR